MHSYHKARRIHGVVSFCLVLSGAFVNAQDPSTPPQAQVPSCISPWNLRNDDGNTPCQTLIKVMTDCDTSKQFTLPNVLQESVGVYAPPTAETSTLEQCQCTEVAYNLYSACAACQVGGDPIHWLDHDMWFAKCNPGEPPIRPATAANDLFNAWITQQYPTKFSLDSALSVAKGGPVLTLASATASSSSPNATAGGSNGSGTVIFSNAVSSPGPSNKTGIIVGAVIGSIAFLALLFLMFFFLRRRQKKHTAPSAEFMKYAQGNTGASAREPLRSHSRANTGDEHANGGYPNRQSYIPHGHGVRLDSPVPGGGPGGGEENGDVMEMSEGGVNPPAFTPGLFKDPIFEKGVALNLAATAAANAGGGGGGPYGGSPITYSPATPSSTVHNHGGMGSERQGLIQGHTRQGTLE